MSDIFNPDAVRRAMRSRATEQFLVEVWMPGATIASNRLVGPFRSEARAEEYAARVRRTFDGTLDAVALWLESAHDPTTWPALCTWVEDDAA